MMSFWSSGFNSVSFVSMSQLLTELSWFNSVGGCSCIEAATGGTNGSGDGSTTGLTSGVYASGRVDRARCPCKLLSITVTALGVPGNCCVGCCNRDMAVPWKYPCDAVEQCNQQQLLWRHQSQPVVDTQPLLTQTWHIGYLQHQWI